MRLVIPWLPNDTGENGGSSEIVQVIRRTVETAFVWEGANRENIMCYALSIEMETDFILSGINPSA